MGMLALLRLMSMKRRQRSQDGGSNASSPVKRKGSPCRHGGNSGGAKRMKSHLTLDSLPQDVLHQIVALLPMQDAARTACVSRQLQLSWRHYPELEFSAKTLALDEQHTCIQGQMVSDCIRRIDGAIQKRAGIWVKRLRFELRFLRKVHGHYIDRWLDAATSGIEELNLELPRDDEMKYRFPCKLFFDEKGCSIQSICLYACAFRPEQGSCSFRSLKRVQFSWVQHGRTMSLSF